MGRWLRPSSRRMGSVGGWPSGHPPAERQEIATSSERRIAAAAGRWSSSWGAQVTELPAGFCGGWCPGEFGGEKRNAAHGGAGSAGTVAFSAPKALWLEVPTSDLEFSQRLRALQANPGVR